MTPDSIGPVTRTITIDANDLTNEKANRSESTATRLKREAELKRWRKAQKRDFDNAATKNANKCHKEGQPSQGFLEYKRIKGSTKMVPMTEDNARFYGEYLVD